MKRILIIVGIVIAALAILGTVGFNYLKTQTKKASPEQVVGFSEAGFDISMKYSSPSVKGRKIFGELVPYGEVWRTGANEPTTFDTKTDLYIAGELLPAGHYTFWTIPNEKTWSLIWNKKDYSWGISFSGKTSRKPEEDALLINVTSKTTESLIENLTINFSNIQNVVTLMTLQWENTKIEVPIAKTKN